MKSKNGRGRRALVPLAGILILLLIAALSGLAGYWSGINLRTTAEKTLVSQQAAEQYELGVQDIQSGFFERARQRFEYVIRLDPSYPGAADMLAGVLLEINTTATPTLVPTVAPTPTPDTRGIDGLFDAAGQQLANTEWDTAIETLLQLRKQDPAYRAVDIDGMLFMALRNRGMDKIAKQADLAFHDLVDHLAYSESAHSRTERSAARDIRAGWSLRDVGFGQCNPSCRCDEVSRGYTQADLRRSVSSG